MGLIRKGEGGVSVLCAAPSEGFRCPRVVEGCLPWLSSFVQQTLDRGVWWERFYLPNVPARELGLACKDVVRAYKHVSKACSGRNKIVFSRRPLDISACLSMKRAWEITCIGQEKVSEFKYSPTICMVNTQLYVKVFFLASFNIDVFNMTIKTPKRLR